MIEEFKSNDSSKPKNGYEPSKEEMGQAMAWEKKIKASKRRRADNGFIWSPKQITKFRNYVNGTQHDDGAIGLVRTNLIHSTIATMLPMIYAKNPDISIMPSESVEQGQYKLIKSFCKTLELVLRRVVIKDGKIKKRAKSMVRSTMTTSIGWLKVIYQKEYGKDPIIMNRISDIQDNIKRIEYLTKEVGDSQGNAVEHEAKRAEMSLQVEALEKQVEIVVAEGIVVDNVLTEDMFLLDNSIRDFDTYPQSRAIAHRVWYTKEGYAEVFGEDPPTSATTFKQNKDEDDAKKPEDMESWYAVFEIWDRISQTVYTKCDGADRWCRPPYQPEKTGERWYPFFALAFNPVDGQFEPISDVQLLTTLQDEYNTTRTNFADHRKENLPGMVVRKGSGLNEDDIDKIINRKINEIVVIEGDPGKPLSDDLMQIVSSPIDPQVYDVSPIRNDMDVVVGLTDASRSNILQAKTLGEAEIMRESMLSRTAERQDAIEDCLLDVIQYSAEILLQELSIEQVKRIAGVDAQWPQLSKEEIFDMVSIEIRAGTTGKPNKEKDRQQWIEFMPIFQDMVIKTMELRASGSEDLAKSMIEMIKETLRRFDERLDIDLFIPNDDEEGDDQALMVEHQKMKEQLTLMQEEMAKLQQAADDNQAKLQIEDKKNASNELVEHERTVSNGRVEMFRIIAPLLSPEKESKGEGEELQSNGMTPEDIQQAVESIIPIIDKVMGNMKNSSTVPNVLTTGE